MRIFSTPSQVPVSVLVLLAAVAVHGAAPIEAQNKDKQGIAIKGYDTVAYFTASKPVKGSPQFQHEWKGAKWHFASAENRDKFAKTPEKYAPQYGGYCAWAVGHNYTADVDPEAWSVVDGELFLNYNKEVKSKWSTEQEKWIAQGDSNWEKLQKK